MHTNFAFAYVELALSPNPITDKTIILSREIGRVNDDKETVLGQCPLLGCR